MSYENKVRLYRIENPNIPPQPKGVTSHEDLIGQWFSPNLETAMIRLRNATQTFGRGTHVVDGTQLVVTDVPRDELDALHVYKHPIASKMDIENDNYIVPRDAGYDTATVPLDNVLGDLRGHLGQTRNLVEARQRVTQVAEQLGKTSVSQQS